LGFRFAWFPAPAGWGTGFDGDHLGFVGRVGVPDAEAEEELHREGIVLVLASGGESEPPTVGTYRIFQWHGVLVHEASGVPEPRPNPATWTVWYTWSTGGHPYRLILAGYPTQGPVGTLASGRSTARQMLTLVRFATPASTPGGG
jgi:hypothetical protein